MSSINPKTKWQPRTQLYNYNYGVGMNFYQSMVDFIEEKSQGWRTKSPHLPWTEELGLSQFNPQHVRSYSERDLANISYKTELSAKKKLGEPRSHASSSFVLSESVSAARLTTKIQQETRKKNKLVKEIKKLQSKMTDDIVYDPDKDKEIERELKAQQKYLRGKSAKGIEAQLLSESRRAIAESIEHDMSEVQRAQVRSFAGRSMRAHMKTMDARMTAQLEQSFVEPLDTLSEELKGFNRRSTHYFIDQR